MRKENEPQISNGGVSPDQIAAWKNVHHKIVEISVVDGDTQHVGYFKRPTMEIMSAVNKLAKSDEVRSSVTMFDGCWLGGDTVLQTDAIVKMAAITQLASLFNTCTGSLKNL